MAGDTYSMIGGKNLGGYIHLGPVDYSKKRTKYALQLGHLSVARPPGFKYTYILDAGLRRIEYLESTFGIEPFNKMFGEILLTTNQAGINVGALIFEAQNKSGQERIKETGGGRLKLCTPDFEKFTDWILASGCKYVQIDIVAVVNQDA